MIARVDSSHIHNLLAVARQSHHPFHSLVAGSFEPIRSAWQRHNVGVIVSNGETGVAAAAMDVAAPNFIPVTGFAQRGMINETGSIKPQHRAFLIEPDHEFATLTQHEVADENRNYAPYARNRLRRESDELNTQYSDAVVVILASTDVRHEWMDGERIRALRDKRPTFVCDLGDDYTVQAARLGQFLMTHRPWFLAVVGARDSLSEMSTYSVYDQARKLLAATFSPHFS